LRSTKENLDKIANQNLMQFPTQNDEENFSGMYYYFIYYIIIIIIIIIIKGLSISRHDKFERNYTKKFDKVKDEDKPWQKMKLQIQDEEIVANI